jgi:predicted RNA-binding protein associated with RNAse of E/G family
VTCPIVRIHYLRPPGREELFRQHLVHEDGSVKVTLARGLARTDPVVIDGKVALEAGSDVVWFTFPGAWHDIGRFHTADGTFTGIYGNVLTPPVFEPGHVWRTTDLFMDVWIPPEGKPRVLDREELDEAAASGWIDEPTRTRALDEVDWILDAAARGRWPPAVVGAWTLERARAAVEALGR